MISVFEVIVVVADCCDTVTSNNGHTWLKKCLIFGFTCGSSEAFQYVPSELSVLDLEEEEEDTNALMELGKLEGDNSDSYAAEDEDNVCIFVCFFK